MHNSEIQEGGKKLELIFGADIAEKIKKSNLLVVGAGGIGCEVMKTLSITGFKKITIIDLDTIDVSNLNRQFLFRREHVDKAKCEVLRDQIKKQNSSIEVEAYLGRIQEERFGFKFFSKFDLVINALDNEEARKHVNNMCFNLNIPLVDSGTNGYSAQCIPICKGKTPCYQCIDRPKDQSFPVCTIRQKPEKMIHCIVWAKALFDGLFGPKEQSNNIIEDIIAQIQSAGLNSNKVQYAAIVFDRVFGFEVQTLMDNLNAKMQHSETPVEEKKEEDQESDSNFIQKIKPLNFSEYVTKIESQLEDSNFFLNKADQADEQSLKILELQDYIFTFVKTILTLYKDREAEIGQLLFNKDDEITIDFVAAAANIRAHNFSIPMESKFKIKEMAGKIIPAISSSNALVAALQVIESIKILSGKFDQLYGIVYQRMDRQRLQSFNRTVEDPNPSCQICTDDSKHIYSLEVQNLSAFTLKQLVETVFIEQWHLSNPLLIEFNNGILFEASDDLDDEDELELYQRRLKKSLFDLKIRDLSILQVQATLNGQSDSKIYVQITEIITLASPFAFKYLKEGVPSQVPSQPNIAGSEKTAIGTMDKDGAVCFSDSDDDISIDNCSSVPQPSSLGIKRKSDVNADYQKIEKESVTAKRVKGDE